MEKCCSCVTYIILNSLENLTKKFPDVVKSKFESVFFQGRSNGIPVSESSAGLSYL